MKEIKITVQYIPANKRLPSHSHEEPWTETIFFCPSCGKPEVWNRSDGGDYYQGETYMCAACGSEWNWPSEPRIEESAENKQRLEHLRGVAGPAVAKED